MSVKRVVQSRAPNRIVVYTQLEGGIPREPLLERVTMTVVIDARAEQTGWPPAQGWPALTCVTTRTGILTGDMLKTEWCMCLTIRMNVLRNASAK